MKTRRLAPVALAAAVLLGATGCTFLTTQATEIPYSAADGVNIPPSGPLLVRNALLVSDEEGTSANFLAAIVNDTDSSATLAVGIDGVNQRVRVPARTTVSLGFEDVDPLLFTDLDTHSGATLPVTFQSGDGEAVEYEVPVLDGALDYLAPFVPTAASTLTN